MSAPRLQIALRVPPEPIPVAGIPAAQRTAHALSNLPEVERCVPSASDSAGAPAADLPTVALSGEGLPDPAAFSRFATEAAAASVRTAWTWRGETIAVWFPAKDAPPRGDEWPPARVAATVAAAEEAWTPVRDAAEARAAEDRLFAALGKPTDGFLSRFDRRVSTALSRRLARTSVTPNQITWVSIAVGLAGALAIGARGWGICLAGTLLVWLSAVLDGCDGEIARVKLLSSPAGARLDLFGDHVVNFATLAAIGVHVRHQRPEGFGVAAVLLLIGVAASAITVALLSPASEPGRLDLMIERLASRDFIYLVIPLAALGRLDWFFWAAAVGSNVFWLSLWALRWRARARPRDTTSQSPA
ncbi:MAG TPA: CDP-alcohol phosphatidyltransferase family protein [Thermoanaerobaculia bacterium]|jgi:phosphatidylglycerophosphate synthase